jgi:hypothetical protein
MTVTFLPIMKPHHYSFFLKSFCSQAEQFKPLYSFELCKPLLHIGVLLNSYEGCL